MARNHDKYFSKPYYFDRNELKREYRVLSKIHHPDCGGTNEAMQLLNSEYEKLKSRQLDDGSDYFQGFAAKSKKPAPSKARKKAQSKAKAKEHEPVWSRQDVLDLLKELDFDYWMDSDMILVDKGNRVYEMRGKLKSVGFWWDKTNKCWYWMEAHSKQKPG